MGIKRRRSENFTYKSSPFGVLFEPGTVHEHIMRACRFVVSLWRVWVFNDPATRMTSDSDVTALLATSRARMISLSLNDRPHRWEAQEPGIVSFDGGTAFRSSSTNQAPPWSLIIPLFNVIFLSISPAPLSTKSPAILHPHSSASASELT